MLVTHCGVGCQGKNAYAIFEYHFRRTLQGQISRGSSETRKKYLETTSRWDDMRPPNLHRGASAIQTRKHHPPTRRIDVPPIRHYASVTSRATTDDYLLTDCPVFPCLPLPLHSTPLCLSRGTIDARLSHLRSNHRTPPQRQQFP